mgnify:FL=1|jgi:preprotein translocase subunit YajC
MEVLERMNHYLATAASTGSGDVWSLFISIALIFLVFYLFLILPQNKRKKKEDKMRNNIQVGDNVTTIGGIVGKVVGIKADTDMFIIETGSERTKVKIKKWAISSVDTVHDDVQ